MFSPICAANCHCHWPFALAFGSHSFETSFGICSFLPKVSRFLQTESGRTHRVAAIFLDVRKVFRGQLNGAFAVDSDKDERETLLGRQAISICVVSWMSRRGIMEQSENKCHGSLPMPLPMPMPTPKPKPIPKPMSVPVPIP